MEEERDFFLITDLGSESQFIHMIPKEICIQPGLGISSIVDAIPVCNQCKTKVNECFKYYPAGGVKSGEDSLG